MSQDSHNNRYGGRLKGGGKGTELSAAEVFGGPQTTPSLPRAHAMADSGTSVDPARLEVGDEISFCYARGARANERRTAWLKEVQTRPAGPLLVCGEISEGGETIERKYWPGLTFGVEYLGKRDARREPGYREEQAMTRQARQGASRAAAGSLPGLELARTSAVPQGASASGAREQPERSKEPVNRQPTVQPALEDLYTVVDPELPRNPPVCFFTGPAMLPVVLRELEAIEYSWCAHQYCVDHTECCVKLNVKLARGVRGRLILDRNMFLNSSCARQAPRIKELWDSGCEMKTLKLKGSGFACMHVKSLILDERVVLSGSVNMTHNGMETIRSICTASRTPAPWRMFRPTSRKIGRKLKPSRQTSLLK